MTTQTQSHRLRDSQAHQHSTMMPIKQEDDESSHSTMQIQSRTQQLQQPEAHKDSTQQQAEAASQVGTNRKRPRNNSLQTSEDPDAKHQTTSRNSKIRIKQQQQDSSDEMDYKPNSLSRSADRTLSVPDHDRKSLASNHNSSGHKSTKSGASTKARRKPLTVEQKRILEGHFLLNAYPTRAEKQRLGLLCNLSADKVCKWVSADAHKFVWLHCILTLRLCVAHCSRCFAAAAGQVVLPLLH